MKKKKPNFALGAMSGSADANIQLKNSFNIGHRR